MISPRAACYCFYSIVSIAFNNRVDREMKLLHRIQALDASRRIDVVNKYIPALLLIDDDRVPSSETNPNNGIVVGHIHSSLVETLRNRLEESGNSAPNKTSFLLPPPLVEPTPPNDTLIRDRFFGLRVLRNNTTEGNSPAALVDARSKVFEDFTDLLLDCGNLRKRHTDVYPVTDLTKPGLGEILATVNRNAAPFLGVTSVGVHLLCYVRDGKDVSLWLAQRAPSKSHNALRWDPTVAGGQPASMGFLENVIKEAGEEAGIDPRAVAENAVSTGCLSQMTCKPDGTCMKQSLYYTWDMPVGVGFVPRPADGEVSAFELCPAERLVHEVRHGDRLRPAMVLVVTGFLIRHGVIAPDNEPDYAGILAAMHRERLVLGCGGDGNHG